MVMTDRINSRYRRIFLAALLALTAGAFSGSYVKKLFVSRKVKKGALPGRKAMFFKSGI